MAKKKKQSKILEVFWRITISTVGVALIVIAIVNLLLFIFGDTATATITTRRFGGADDGRPAEQRYEWVIAYTFQDRDGVSYGGHTSRRGSDTMVEVDNSVRYFNFAPYISSLESEAKPNFGQFLLIMLGFVLLYVMNKKKKQVRSVVKSADLYSNKSIMRGINT